MKMEFDISKMVEEIAMQAEENQEEFIFQTIRPYCENILQIKINKEELKQILLNGIRKQQPCETIHGSTYGGVSWGGTYTFEEQQPSEDCISRQAVLDYIEGSGAELGHSSENELVCQDIKKLPSVTPQQTRWIPVSERLPDNRGYYLTTVKIEIHDLNILYYEIRTAQFDGEDFDIGYIGDGFRVIAWMPLPEPYKESDSE